MIITILSVSKNQMTTKAGKPYFQLEVAYKGEDGQVKGKKIMPFGSTKPVFDTLQHANSGEAWEVTPVKEGEYWVWTSAKKSDGSAPAASTPSATSSPAGKVVGSNYETKEERAARQVMIVRQSSLANAISTLTVGSKSVDPTQVIKLAKEYEAYVMGTTQEPVVSMSAALTIEDMEDDIPV